MLGASLFFLGEKSPKGNILFSREYLSQKKNLIRKKNHKLIFQESIATISISTDYNFEETSENICPQNNFKIV
jgi:hypothetical protein